MPEIDRDRIRVIRQPPAASDPLADREAARAWGCFVVGFLSGALASAAALFILWRVTR